MEKILFYSDSAIFGGHEKIFIDLISSIDFHKYEVFFIISRKNKKLIEEIKRSSCCVNNVYIEDVSSGSFNGIRSLFNLFQLYRVHKLIKKIKPDVIILIQGMIELSVTPLLIPVSCNVISYIPQVLPLRKTGAILGGIRDRINVVYYRKLNKIITISENNKDICTKYWKVDRNRVVVVNNGIDITHESQNTKQDNVFRFLCLGRFDLPCKRQDKLIEIFIRELGDIEHVQLHIVGSGDVASTNKLRNMSLASNKVYVSNWVQDSLSLIDTVDALVINSSFEGVPLVALESMLKGVPVISTNLPYCSNLKHLNGFFVEDSNHNVGEIMKEVYYLGKKRYPELSEYVYEHHDLNINAIKFMNEICDAIESK